jgi:hypothetical protein
VALVLGAFVVLEPWYEGVQWRGSPDAARAQRNADVPQPIWLTPAPTDLAVAPAAAGSTPTIRRTVPTLVQPAATRQPAPTTVPVAGQPTIAPVPQVEAATPTPTTSDLQLVGAEFQFLDPPEPGARARLTVSVHNPTDQPSQQIGLALPLNWLNGYRLEAADPMPLDGTLQGSSAEGALHLTFGGPDANADVDLTVDMVTTDEVIDAPLLKMVDANGRAVGQTQPPTEAPQPRPGPVYSIDIPRLTLHAGVLPVDWEPPLFVVGQIRTSAFVTEGNSVLVGHVRGDAGYNVFDHLDQLALGDTIVASSRGQTYDFVVSQKQILPEDDISPTVPSSTARLTLMTCAGTWNPLTRDYSDRLWVVAEPPEAAAATIAAAQMTPTPVPMPTPVVPMQISAPGGLANTDADLSAAWRAPVGESPSGLAVYHPGSGSNTTEHRAQLADVPAGARRALVVANVFPTTSPLTFEAAVAQSRTLFPKDTQPRDAGPEGNQQFVVERFTSPNLAATLPPEWFADRQGQPGDFIVVYGRRSDGRIAFFAVGVGDDAERLLDLLKDVRPDRAGA